MNEHSTIGLGGLALVGALALGPPVEAGSQHAWVWVHQPFTTRSAEELDCHCCTAQRLRAITLAGAYAHANRHNSCSQQHLLVQLSTIWPGSAAAHAGHHSSAREVEEMALGGVDDCELPDPVRPGQPGSNLRAAVDVLFEPPADLSFVFESTSFLQVDLSSVMPGEVVGSRLSLNVGAEEVGTVDLSGSRDATGQPQITLALTGIFEEFDPRVVDHGSGQFSVALPSPRYTGPGATPDAEAELHTSTGPVEDCDGNGVSDVVDIANGRSQDCNENGVPDECDIAFGTSADCNVNGVPDECEPEPPCPTDSNGDCVVDFADILNVLATWGPCRPDR